MATLRAKTPSCTDRSANKCYREPQVANIDNGTGYIANIDDIRNQYYPTLRGTTYLDHAGAATYPNTLIDAYSDDLKSNLFGNPHSASASSQLSTRRIDTLRVQVLHYINADPDQFDIIFTANATAAIKLVADAFRDHDAGFWFGYHCDAHTSLIGIRAVATAGSQCMTSADMEDFIRDDVECIGGQSSPLLLAYPGQSNMTGQRYSLDWCRRLRQKSSTGSGPMYSIYDAASLLSTGELDLSDPDHAPDFTVLSFYKMFGFPDLGGLVVRKASAKVLQARKYFGGGTVDAVSTTGVPWHASKKETHSALEDGTLPFHTIIALEHASKAHMTIFGSARNICQHTQYLTCIAYRRMRSLCHANGRSLCTIYSNDPDLVPNSGPIVTFNLVDSRGNWISTAEVEKLAIVRGIQFRTGGLCNPGGTAKHLNLSTDQIQRNYRSGYRCGGATDIFDGQPTGTIRISFGASSALEDIDNFIAFLEDFFVDRSITSQQKSDLSTTSVPQFIVDSITIYPIKSCRGFSIPPNMNWKVHPEGLQFDREWCLVHQGTNIALNQKQFPQMALLQPSIDLGQRQLRLEFCPNDNSPQSITIDLDSLPAYEGIMSNTSGFRSQSSQVCGELIPVHIYTSRRVSDFFSSVLNVPCTLARVAHDQPRRRATIRRPASSPDPSPDRNGLDIKLSNESPILLVSQSSVNKLNQDIRNKRAISHHPTGDTDPDSTRNNPEVSADSFRANIVIANRHGSASATDQAYLEDKMKCVTIRGSRFDILGPCQRCQMVCVDQKSGVRRMEPFSTLARTRRRDGRVWFGVHLCLACDDSDCDRGVRTVSDGGVDLTDQENAREACVIAVGDVVDVQML